MVNIVLLAVVLIGQARAGRARWLGAMRQGFAVGVALYLAWAAIGLLAPPWLFHGAPADVTGLPERIQNVLYERADPILLKCDRSPHIYLLEGGQKRWIRDIGTLTAAGYRWSDVVTWVSCEDLRAVPDGETIPPGSGSPPQP